MKRNRKFVVLTTYILLIAVFLGAGIGIDRGITAFSQTMTPKFKHTFVIDAGHGGVDGGATSVSGILESKYNLEIAMRLNDLMHLLGMHTVMIRTDDRSVHTEGESIAAKKISDLKNRLFMIENTDNPVLVSIHQNHFTDSRYSGAQIFYAPTNDSDILAKKIQSAFIQTLNPGSRRQAKKADSIYIMQHISCTGILVECGFLSNRQEDHLLQSSQYQQKICAVIATGLSQHYYAHALT